MSGRARTYVSYSLCQFSFTSLRYLDLAQGQLWFMCIGFTGLFSLLHQSLPLLNFVFPAGHQLITCLNNHHLQIFSSGLRCCNPSWLPLILWREISLDIFQIWVWELIIWISDYTKTSALKIIIVYLSSKSGLSCSCKWRHSSLSWSVLDRVWGFIVRRKNFWPWDDDPLT